MASMPSRNTLRNAQSAQRRTSGSVRSGRTISSDSSDDSESDDPDYEAIRNHRRRYPARRSDVRPRRTEPEVVRTISSRRNSDVLDRRRHSRPSGDSSPDGRSRNTSRHEHHSRRSAKGDGRRDIVYKRRVVASERQLVRPSSLLLPQRKSSFIPDVLQSLRAPRLSSIGTPVRNTRAGRQAEDRSSSSRRHSYHGQELQRQVRTVRRVADSRSSSRSSVNRYVR